jgi:excisionase family DNA binding protein
MVTMVEEKLYTVDEAAEYLKVSPFTLRDWLRADRIHGFRMGGTRLGWRIPESELKRFVDEMRHGRGGRSED